MKRWLVRGALCLLALEALYVLAANVLLNCGLVPRWVNGATPQVHVGWERAITVWPGQAWVKRFSMQFDDENMVQLDLNVEDSSVGISMLGFTRRTFVLSRGRASGVSYRMNIKVSEEEARGMPERVAAFPRVPGFAFPPLKPAEPPPRASQAEIDRLWRIELADIESDLTEVWIGEYRYVGDAHVKGSFEFAPVKELSVGPASLSFDGGRLTAGEHVIFPRFEAKVRTTIAKADVSGPPDRIFPKLTASLQTSTPLAGLGFVGFYADGLVLEGGGPFQANIDIVDGKVRPSTTVHLAIDELKARALGMKVAGKTTFDAAVSEKGRPVLKVVAKGALTTPPLQEETLTIDIGTTIAEAWLSTADLAAPPELERFTVVMPDARANDARPLTRLAGKYVPLIAPAVLGDGPLTLSAKARIAPSRVVITLDRAALGAAGVSGAVLQSETGWNGAALGAFDKLKLGFTLQRTKFGFEAIANETWLGEALKGHGIEGAALPAPVKSPAEATPAPPAGAAGRPARSREP